MKTQLTLRMPGQLPSSFHLHFLGICLTLITACSVFKEKSFLQADSLQRQKRTTSEKLETHLQSQAVRMYSSVDSTDQGFYTEIFPEGFFKYSATEGFSGNAKKLIVKGRSKTFKHQASNTLETHDGTFKRDFRESNLNKVKTKVKQKHLKPSGLAILYLMGCLSLFAGIYFMRRFLEKRGGPGLP